MLNLTEQQQIDIVKFTKSCSATWEMQLNTYMSRMARLYEAVTTFRSKKRSKWRTDFKVNKAFEVENKVLPRIVAHSPSWITSLRTDEFDAGDRKKLTQEQLEEKHDTVVSKAVLAIRDYLKESFDKDDTAESVELRVKNTVRYGMGWAKVGYMYDIERQKRGNGVMENVFGQRPVIEVMNRSDILFDPRYLSMKDFPGIIETKRGVRLSYFTKAPEEYENIDKLLELAKAGTDASSSAQSYKDRVYAITGIAPTGGDKFNMNDLTIKKSYVYFEIKKDEDSEDEMDGSGESLYEFWTVNDMVLVYAKEITQIPFEVIKCFPDTDTFLATGFLEQIIGLQEELNFKKNSASEYINQALNRNWIRSPMSGINPKHLNSAPGNIIPTTKDGATAQQNTVELQFRQLPVNYFQEQADFERQIQSMTFTIDTSSQTGNQALTNTATGIKVKAFESNSVVNYVRKNFERAMSRLAYKFLQCTFENLDDNVIIKKLDDEGFWNMNKEIMRDAIRRYAIKIEAGSSTFDSQEQRRADAIAQWNIAQQAKAAGVNVDLGEQYKRLMSTFEGVDENKLLKAEIPQLGPQPPAGGGGRPLPMPVDQPNAGDIPL